MFISHWLLDDLSELSGSLFTSRDDKTYKECATHMNDAKVFLLFLSIICEMVKICVRFIIFVIFVCFDVFVISNRKSKKKVSTVGVTKQRCRKLKTSV